MDFTKVEKRVEILKSI